MKKLLLTISIGDVYQDIAKMTHPLLQDYARKIGADFMSINEQKISETTPHWEKFQIYDLFDQYDRILYLDTDIVVRDDCPDLFEIVPDDKLAMFNEAKFTFRSKEMMIDICREYGVTLPGWDGKYYNSGVIVIPKVYRGLFKKPDKEVFSFYEQSYLNMVIARDVPSIFELNHNFNRMSCMDRFVGENRHNSYIIHYAGFPSYEFVRDIIRSDIELLREGNIDTRKHIYVAVTGGLGDQICAEPAIRYMRHLYPGAEIVVATHFPRMFRHLDVDVVKHGQANLKDDTAYFIVESLPGPDAVQWGIMSHLLVHPVDYSTVAIMKRQIPVLDRRIKFQITESDTDKIKNILGDSFSGYVVVHAGRHWSSKTFPTEYWQEIIDGLSAKGIKVVLIGKDEQGDPPDFKAGARGTVDVVCPDTGIDLRNKLSLGELAALISLCPILLSNDSAPVHLAGAFDNWIVLIPSCKHQDNVFPYRNGSIVWRTRALYKRLVIDDIESRPTEVYPVSADIENIKWDDYLLPPSDVVENISTLWQENKDLQ